MQSELMAVMQEANREIGRLVSKLSENSAEASHAGLSTGELNALSQKLARVAKLLDRVSTTQSKEQELQAVLGEYVDNLEKLKGVLGRATDSLEKHRDRLKKNLEHLNLARAWVQTFRATN